MGTPMISRRGMLKGGAGLLFGSTATAILAGTNATAKQMSSGPCWAPRRLDPLECARTAYEGYWDENGGVGSACSRA
jgi:hypothetical protein